jgi:hypothetical protein
MKSPLLLILFNTSPVALYFGTPQVRSAEIDRSQISAEIGQIFSISSLGHDLQKHRTLLV